MRKTAFVIFVVLSLGFLGCASRQNVQPVPGEEEEIIDVSIPLASENGRVVVVSLYVGDRHMMTYEYFDGDMRAQLGEMSGVSLRAAAIIRSGDASIIIYFDDNNIVRGLSEHGREINVSVECSQSEVVAQRCEEIQERWNRVYVRLELERRVVEALRR